jgi:CheY-like chemotaxis protein
VSKSLANVAKHAKASRIRIHVGHQDGNVVASIQDDGIGGADPARGSQGRADRPMVWLTVCTPAPGPTTISSVMSVLIVDDHRSFRASARRLLEAEGFTVIGEAADGLTAIAAAQELEPDVVLLDVQLPDLDGFEVAARLAAIGSRAAVVLTSSRAAAEYGSLIADCPAHGFIPKSELSGAAITGLISR